MRRIFYFSAILISLTGLYNCNSRQDSTLVIPPLTQNYAAISNTKEQITTAYGVYLKTKDNAKKWSKDAILINVYLNSNDHDTNYERNWSIYYYSKDKEKIFSYYDNNTGKYNEISLNDPLSIGLLPRCINAPYREIENWKIDSNKALELSGINSNAVLNMFMEYNQKSQKMEWNIISLDDVYVDINTGAVRKTNKLGF